jgi:probable dihydroxyacetone kinase regulator
MADSNITKNALAASMKKLMKERSFSKISVTDICNDCGMNRKSFYYHFKDKYDLVNWIFYIGFIDNIVSKEYKNSWELFADICTHFFEEKDFYQKALMIEGQNSFRDYFFQILYPMVEFFVKDSLTDSVEQEFLITFVCDAIISSLVRWLSEGVQMPLEQFLEEMQSVMVILAERIIEEYK